MNQRDLDLARTALAVLNDIMELFNQNTRVSHVSEEDLRALSYRSIQQVHKNKLHERYKMIQWIQFVYVPACLKKDKHAALRLRYVGAIFFQPKKFFDS